MLPTPLLLQLQSRHSGEFYRALHSFAGFYHCIPWSFANLTKLLGVLLSLTEVCGLSEELYVNGFVIQRTPNTLGQFLK